MLNPLDILHVCTVHQWRLKHFIIQQMHKYIIRRYNYNYYKINRHDRTIIIILAKHCIKLPDHGSLVIRNMLEQF